MMDATLHARTNKEHLLHIGQTESDWRKAMYSQSLECVGGKWKVPRSHSPLSLDRGTVSAQQWHLSLTLASLLLLSTSSLWSGPVTLEDRDSLLPWVPTPSRQQGLNLWRENSVAQRLHRSHVGGWEHRKEQQTFKDTQGLRKCTT